MVAAFYPTTGLLNVTWDPTRANYQYLPMKIHCVGVLDIALEWFGIDLSWSGEGHLP